MRASANFHPEWGYLAPAPSFIRRVRVVLVATTLGAIVGAGVGLFPVSHQATELSVAARTLVRPIETASAGANSPAPVSQANAPSSTKRLMPGSNSRSVDGATSKPGDNSTTWAPERIAALAEAPAATEGLATAAIAAPPVVAKKPVGNIVSIKKKSKKSITTWRYASRDERLGLVPGEYSTRRSWDGYYGDSGGRRYQNW
jgi:hypothetical protein